jgi:hypothetical protein
MITGLVGLVIFFLDIYAIKTVIQGGLPKNTKILWCLLVAFLPVLGLAIWFLAGPKENA